MRLIKLSILLISISGSTSAQEFIDTMYFSGEWEQSIREKAEYYRIISSDTSGEFRFLVEDFYFSGQIQMSGTYKSIRPDNKDGHFIYYNPLGGKRQRQQGAVIVLFTVDEEGNVQNPVVVEGDIASFNQEALRIAAAMPRWIPGEVDAVPSPMQVSIPIEFSLL